MTTTHKALPENWELIRHEPTSDYGEDAYTLWPYGAVLKQLSPEAAAAINAARDMLAALEMQQMADYDPEASHRKGYFVHARELREAAIAKATQK
jgi:hypothetical protein